MNVFDDIRYWNRLALLFLLIVGCAGAKTQSRVVPRFEDYSVKEIFSGVLALPKLVTATEQLYSDQIRDGVEDGYGVFRNGKEQRGPNFAGSLIVIQWGCGAPCMRMALVNGRTGEVYYPPISINGVGAQSFDLPLLMIGNSVPQNPEIQFRQDSNLMIIKATTEETGQPRSYTFYVLWNQNRWTLLKKLILRRRK